METSTVNLWRWFQSQEKSPIRNILLTFNFQRASLITIMCFSTIFMICSRTLASKCFSSPKGKWHNTKNRTKSISRIFEDNLLHEISKVQSSKLEVSCTQVHLANKNATFGSKLHISFGWNWESTSRGSASLFQTWLSDPIYPRWYVTNSGMCTSLFPDL